MGRLIRRWSLPVGLDWKLQNLASTTCATDLSQSNTDNAGCLPPWLLLVQTFFKKELIRRESTVIIFLFHFEFWQSSALWVFHLAPWPISYPHVTPTTPCPSTSTLISSEMRWKVAQMATIKTPFGTSTLGKFRCQSFYKLINNIKLWISKMVD